MKVLKFVSKVFRFKSTIYNEFTKPYFEFTKPRLTNLQQTYYLRLYVVNLVKMVKVRVLNLKEN